MALESEWSEWVGATTWASNPDGVSAWSEWVEATTWKAPPTGTSDWSEWVEATTWAEPKGVVVQVWDGVTLVDVISVQVLTEDGLVDVNIEVTS